MHTTPRLVHRLAAVGFALLTCVAAANAGAQPADPARTPASAPYTRGVLWKIESPGRTPSHLFGTVHTADPRVTDLPAAVREAFDPAARLVTELLVDPIDIAQAQQAMHFDDGRKLSDIVDPDVYADTSAALARRGVPEGEAATLKPWAAAVILALPPPTGPPLDRQLQLRAERQGKPVHSLETAAEQSAVFDDLSLADQRALLRAALRMHPTADAHAEALIQAYLARDLVRLLELSREYAASERALHGRLMRRLLTDRNRLMVERMRAPLRQGNAFIAVGAAHLPGRDGLLALLAREGYRLHAVY